MAFLLFFWQKGLGTERSLSLRPDLHTKNNSPGTACLVIHLRGGMARKGGDGVVRELEGVGKKWESTASWDSEIESKSWPPQEGQGEGPGRL